MTIEMTEKGNLPRKLDVPEGARLRVVTHHKVSLDKIRRVMDIAKSRFKPESLSFVNKAGLKRDSVNVADLGTNWGGSQTASLNILIPEQQQCLR